MKAAFFSLIVLTVLSCCPASANFAVLGSDYLQTLVSSSFNFGPPFGTVNFVGKPLGAAGLGFTDTVIERKADATIGGPAVPIQVVNLSLKSAAPVSVGGNSYNVFVSLDPGDLALDTGTIKINGSAAGGRFNSSFKVFFDATFVEIGHPAVTMSSGPVEIDLSQNGAFWTPIPHGTVIVSGLVGDQQADLHTNLARGEVDFFPGKIFSENSNGSAHHNVQPAIVPEPAYVWPLGGGVLAICALRRRRAVV